jgi:hypothetical protein
MVLCTYVRCRPCLSFSFIIIWFSCLKVQTVIHHTPRNRRFNLGNGKVMDETKRGNVYHPSNEASEILVPGLLAKEQCKSLLVVVLLF